MKNKKGRGRGEKKMGEKTLFFSKAKKIPVTNVAA